MAPKQIDGYTLDERLAKGAYGELWRGRCASSGEVVGIKVVKRQVCDEVDRLRQEIRILRRLSHENVVRLIDVKKTASRFYLVLEACPGGDLGQLLRASGVLPEDVAWEFFAQIMAGLQALHTHACTAHGDLRPGNILVVPHGPSPSPSCNSSFPCWSVGALPTLKLANFGSGGRPSAASLYAAPEVLRGEVPGTKADTWGAGIIFFELLAGTPPNAILGNEKTTSVAELAAWESISAEFRGCRGDDVRILLEGLLAQRPGDRFSDAEILEIVSARLAAAGPCDAAVPMVDGEGALLGAAPWACRVRRGSTVASDLLPIILEAEAEAEEGSPCARAPLRATPTAEAPTFPGFGTGVLGRLAGGVLWLAGVPPTFEGSTLAPLGREAAPSGNAPVAPLDCQQSAQPPRPAIVVLAGAPRHRGPLSGAWPVSAFFGHGGGSNDRYLGAHLGHAAGAMGLGGLGTTVVSFLTGQLRASHMFRLQTARLFPRILYTI